MKKPRLRAMVGIAAAVAAIAIIAVFALLGGPLGKPGDASALVRIEKGSSAAEVAALLRGQNLIRSKALFQLVLRVTGTDKKLKAGTYRIARGASAPSIMAILAEGRTSQLQVTIPEGSTTRIIGGILENAGVCGAAEFVMAAADPSIAAKFGVPGRGLEGFLFPDTYLFSEKSGAEEVIEIMTRNFFAKIKSLAPDALGDEKKLYDDVILASIVEREYRVASEAGLIASVFKNRLRIGMALQSCATVVYVLTEKQGKPHPKVVHYSDLAIQDPYNTYNRRGLPPGPISNPGETALRAVFNSPKSDYLYFRLIDEVKGLHKFSRTFEEHVGEAIPVKGF